MVDQKEIDGNLMEVVQIALNGIYGMSSVQVVMLDFTYNVNPYDAAISSQTMGESESHCCVPWW